jgi:flagellar biosynthesis/type III secretory pathway chaperone
MEENIQQLIETIQSDTDLCEKLIKVLAKEKQSLEKHDLNSLEQQIDEKSKLIIALHNNQLIRDNVQKKLGAEPGFAGLRKILTLIKPSAALELLVEKLASLLEELRSLSTINSKIISCSHAQSSMVLDVLYGRSSQTYDNKASAVHTTPSDTIAKA